MSIFPVNWSTRKSAPYVEDMRHMPYTLTRMVRPPYGGREYRERQRIHPSPKANDQRGFACVYVYV